MKWIKIIEPKDAATFEENRPQLLLMEGKRICLVKRNEKFFAVDDTCAHRGESLSKGKINFLGEVVCPLHQYQFNLKTGRESEQRCRDIACYRMEENDDGIFILL